MKKRIITLVVLMLTLLNQSVFVLGSEVTADMLDTAEKLHEIGIINGTEILADGTPNFDLDRTPTRIECITFLIHLMGNAHEVEKGGWTHPFTDVPSWADQYIGYAYQTKLTSGTGATTFGSNNPVTAQQFVTMLLRVLRFSEGEGKDFSYATATIDAVRLGIVTKAQMDACKDDFIRGDMVLFADKMVIDNRIKTFSDTLDKLSFVIGMNGDDFNNAMKSIMLESGSSIYQTGVIYTATGLHSNSHAYGDMANMAEYTISNSGGKIHEDYSIYLSSDLPGVIFPEKIKYGDSFQSVLNNLDLTEKYEISIAETQAYYPPNFSVPNSDETKSIGVSFHTVHGEPTNTSLESAEATVFYHEKAEGIDDNGKKHTYFRHINLNFSSGILKSYMFSYCDEYNFIGEPKINNDKVGIKFIAPEYKERAGYNYQIRAEEIYHQDQKIYITYSVKSETKTDFSVGYVGMSSADVFASFTFRGGGSIFPHTVNGEERFTDIIEYQERSSWNNDLNTAYLELSGSPIIPTIVFSNGNVYLRKPSDNI